ncbi:hypothetical protein TNCV_3200331 [Trichonephila clavipes]|nr:hypothetical protein TNCV_3200331 [Trichonephila clavipes]
MAKHSWPVCLEFEPSTIEHAPCRRADARYSSVPVDSKPTVNRDVLRVLEALAPNSKAQTRERNEAPTKDEAQAANSLRGL